MNHALIRAAVLSGLAALLTTTAAAAPELILLNGKLYTGEPATSSARALAVEDGRINAVGSDADIRALAGPATRIVDAGGRLVVPGLVEAHVHIGWGLPSPPLAMPGLPFPGPSAEQVLAAVEAEAKSGAGWISAWIGPRVARDPRNWRAALDAVAPHRPVLLRGFWGHTTIVNSAALAALGIAENVADPIGGWWGRDKDGRLDGRAYEAAEDLELRAAPPDAARLAEVFAAASRRYARWGVTSIHLMNSGSPLGVTIDALKRARPVQSWTVYAWAGALREVDAAWQAMAAAVPEAPAGVRIEGPKWMLDGTPLEQNALRRDDYPDRPGWRGRSNLDDTRLREILSRALASPRQLALHVVGDAQTDRLLATMRELASPEVWRSKRVRLEHGDGIRPDTLARVAELGLVVVQNPTHFPPPVPGAQWRACDAGQPGAWRGLPGPRLGRRRVRAEPVPQHHAGIHLCGSAGRSAFAGAGTACLHRRRRTCRAHGAGPGSIAPGARGHSRRAFAGRPDGRRVGSPGHAQPSDPGRWRCGSRRGRLEPLTPSRRVRSRRGQLGPPRSHPTSALSLC